MDEDTRQLLIFGAWALIYLLGVLAKRRRSATPARPPAPPPAGGGRAIGEHRGVFSGGPAPGAGLDALRRDAAAGRAEAAELASGTEGDPRMARLRPVLLDEVAAPLEGIAAALDGKPPREEQARLAWELDHRRRLLGYLEAMVAQRRTMDLRYLGDADAVAEACFRPVIDFTVAEGVPHATAVPVTVHGAWDLSIDLAFRASRIAPVRLPDDFGRSLWAWPALAHEVAHDLYFSVAGFEDEILTRFDLPRGSFVPSAVASVQHAHALYGPWMAELFADVSGVLMMGPAYVETMLRLFASPARPIEARVAPLGPGGVLGPHPPRRLRVWLSCEALDYLGRHAEASSLRARWASLHDDIPAYVLPTARGWVEVPASIVEAPGQAIVVGLVEEHWTALHGFSLLDVPGFAYLHAEHAEVERLRLALQEGRVVRSDARRIVAAGVLAVSAEPTRHAVVLEATRRSIVGVGTGERRYRRAPDVRAAPPAATLGEALRDPEAILEALVVGEALRPRAPHAWRPGRVDSGRP